MPFPFARFPLTVRLRRWSPVALLALAACGGEGGATDASTPSATEPLSCANPSIDFGEVWEGDVLDHEFALKVGAKDLTIHNIVADCGCTAADLERVVDGERVDVDEGDVIPAGSDLTLTVTLETGGRPGRSTRRVKLYTNRGTGAFAVTLTVDAQAVFVVDPDPLPVLRVAQGSPGLIEMQVRRADGGAFRIEPAEDTAPFDVEVEPEAPGDDGRAALWQVRATTRPDVRAGTSTYKVRLVSDLPRGSVPEEPGGPPKLDEPDTLTLEPIVSLQVTAPVTLAPRDVNFGAMAANETVVQTLRLAATDPTVVLPEPELAFEGDDRGPSLLAATARFQVRPVDGENAWDIEVALDGLDPGVGQSFRDRLLVTTGHPRVPQITVLVRGFRAAERAGSAPGASSSSEGGQAGGGVR